MSGEKGPTHDLQLCMDCHVPCDCIGLTDASTDMPSSPSLDHSHDQKVHDHDYGMIRRYMRPRIQGRIPTREGDV